MNILTVEIQEGKYPKVQFLIDGVNLVDMLREYELPFAKKEGSTNIAGSYQAYKFNKNEIECLLGRGNLEDVKFELMDCDCGNPGCWPLLAIIEKDGEYISWSKFEQPQKAEENKWNYSKFGPFIFEFSQYRKEVEKLKCT